MTAGTAWDYTYFNGAQTTNAYGLSHSQERNAVSMLSLNQAFSLSSSCPDPSNGISLEFYAYINQGVNSGGAFISRGFTLAIVDAAVPGNFTSASCASSAAAPCFVDVAAAASQGLATLTRRGVQFGVQLYSSGGFPPGFYAFSSATDAVPPPVANNTASGNTVQPVPYLPYYLGACSCIRPLHLAC